MMYGWMKRIYGYTAAAAVMLCVTMAAGAITARAEDAGVDLVSEGQMMSWYQDAAKQGGIGVIRQELVISGKAVWNSPPAGPSKAVVIAIFRPRRKRLS